MSGEKPAELLQLAILALCAQVRAEVLLRVTADRIHLALSSS